MIWIIESCLILFLRASQNITHSFDIAVYAEILTSQLFKVFKYN